MNTGLPTATEISTLDLRDSRRFATPVLPYNRGFEDARYNNHYCNPYPAGSSDFLSYHTGFEDGRVRKNEVGHEQKIS